MITATTRLTWRRRNAARATPIIPRTILTTIIAWVIVLTTCANVLFPGVLYDKNNIKLGNEGKLILRQRALQDDQAVQQEEPKVYSHYITIHVGNETHRLPIDTSSDFLLLPCNITTEAEPDPASSVCPDDCTMKDVAICEDGAAGERCTVVLPPDGEKTFETNIRNATVSFHDHDELTAAAATALATSPLDLNSLCLVDNDPSSLAPIAGFSQSPHSLLRQLSSHRPTEGVMLSLCFGNDDASSNSATIGTLHDFSPSSDNSSPLVWAKNVATGGGGYDVHIRRMYLGVGGGDDEKKLTEAMLGAMSVWTLESTDEAFYTKTTMAASYSTTTILPSNFKASFESAFVEITGMGFSLDGFQVTSPRQEQQFPTIFLQLESNIPNQGALQESAIPGLVGPLLDSTHPNDVLLAIPPSHYLEWMMGTTTAEDETGLLIPTLSFATTGVAASARAWIGAKALAKHQVVFDQDRIGIMERAESVHQENGSTEGEKDGSARFPGSTSGVAEDSGVILASQDDLPLNQLAMARYGTYLPKVPSNVEVTFDPPVPPEEIRMIGDKLWRPYRNPDGFNIWRPVPRSYYQAHDLPFPEDSHLNSGDDDDKRQVKQERKQRLHTASPREDQGGQEAEAGAEDDMTLRTLVINGVGAVGKHDVSGTGIEVVHSDKGRDPSTREVVYPTDGDSTTVLHYERTAEDGSKTSPVAAKSEGRDGLPYASGGSFLRIGPGAISSSAALGVFAAGGKAADDSLTDVYFHICGILLFFVGFFVTAVATHDRRTDQRQPETCEDMRRTYDQVKDDDSDYYCHDGFNVFVPDLEENGARESLSIMCVGGDQGRNNDNNLRSFFQKDEFLRGLWGGSSSASSDWSGQDGNNNDNNRSFFHKSKFSRGRWSGGSAPLSRTPDRRTGSGVLQDDGNELLHGSTRRAGNQSKLRHSSNTSTSASPHDSYTAAAVASVQRNGSARSCFSESSSRHADSVVESGYSEEDSEYAGDDYVLKTPSAQSPDVLLKKTSMMSTAMWIHLLKRRTYHLSNGKHHERPNVLLLHTTTTRIMMMNIAMWMLTFAQETYVSSSKDDHNDNKLEKKGSKSVYSGWTEEGEHDDGFDDADTFASTVESSYRGGGRPYYDDDKDYHEGDDGDTFYKEDATTFYADEEDDIDFYKQDGNDSYRSWVDKGSTSLSTIYSEAGEPNGNDSTPSSTGKRLGGRSRSSSGFSDSPSMMGALMEGEEEEDDKEGYKEGIEQEENKEVHSDDDEDERHYQDEHGGEDYNSGEDDYAEETRKEYMPDEGDDYGEYYEAGGYVPNGGDYDEGNNGEYSEAEGCVPGGGDYEDGDNDEYCGTGGYVPDGGDYKEFDNNEYYEAGGYVPDERDYGGDRGGHNGDEDH